MTERRDRDALELINDEDSALCCLESGKDHIRSQMLWSLSDSVVPWKSSAENVYFGKLFPFFILHSFLGAMNSECTVVFLKACCGSKQNYVSICVDDFFDPLTCVFDGLS